MIKVDERLFTITLSKDDLSHIKQLLWCAEDALTNTNTEWLKAYTPEEAHKYRIELEQILKGD